MTTFDAQSLEIPEDREAIGRADLVFYGVDHSTLSYEARVFFDNPKATEATPQSAEEGYAGSFTVFGHAGCYGGADHCAPDQRYRDEFDRRPPHPLVPFTRTVTVSEAIRRVAGPSVGVTTVVVVREQKGITNAPTVAPFESVRLLVYQD